MLVPRRAGAATDRGSRSPLRPCRWGSPWRGTPWTPRLPTLTVVCAHGRAPDSHALGFLVVTLHSLEPLRPWKEDQLGPGYLISSGVERHAVELPIASSRSRRRCARMSSATSPLIPRGGVTMGLIPMPLPDSAAECGPAPWHPGAVRASWVGISEQKGLFDLVEAASALPPTLTVALCAATPDTTSSGILAPARIGREPRHTLDPETPPRPRRRGVTAMGALRLRRRYEPFGLMSQATACETPCVASAVGGIVEVVRMASSPVPPGRPAELAAAIRTLLDDPSRARAMGVAGRRRVEGTVHWAGREAADRRGRRGDQRA